MRKLRYSNNKISFLTKSKLLVKLLKRSPFKHKLTVHIAQRGYTSVYIKL